MMAKAKRGDVISYGSGTAMEGSPMPGFWSRARSS